MKIQSVTLPSTNIDAQERLFANTLGFPCSRPSVSALVVHVGASKLIFERSDKQFYFHYCFLIATGDLESAIALLDQSKVDPLLYQGQRIVQFDNGRSVYFHDGDGNLAEFIERPSLGIVSTKTFQADAVICINEMGLPALAPKEYGRQLKDAFAIQCAEEAPWRDDFVWCGDFEGAFVIPVIGRNWIPLNKPAEHNEVKVEFETVSGIHQFAVGPE